METNSNIIRQINTISIIHFLQAERSATKREIADATGLSFPTVGKILAELLDMGEIQGEKYDASNGGRPAERFVINASHTMVLALILSEHSFEYQVCDSLRKVIVDRSILPRDDEDRYEKMFSIIEGILQTYTSVKAISIGVPCSVSKGELHFMPQVYKAFEGQKLGAILEERFGLPVILENDINAIAQGQYNGDKNKYQGSLAYLFNSEDGMGMGITINGKLVRGDHGQAGEVGYVPSNGTKRFIDEAEEAKTDEELADVFGRLAIAAACFFNPSYFILSGYRITNSLKEAIIRSVESYDTGKLKLPEIEVIDDTRELYFSYLVDAALESIYSYD